MKNLFKTLIFFIIISTASGQNFWMEVENFYSSPDCFAFDSSGGIYTGTLDQGVFYSGDNGITWTGKSNGLVDMNIYSLARSFNGLLFAGTFNHGVFISTNNGNLWFQSGLTVQSKIRAIVMTLNGTIIAASDGNGVYRSTNNGANWQKMNSPPSVYSLCVTAPGYIVAGSRNPDCIYASLDDGITWQAEFSYSNTFNSIASTYDGNVYSVTGDLTTENPLGYILAKSNTYGLSWFVSSNFPSSSYGVTVNKNGDLFIGRYYNIWKSTNGGTNWETLSSGLDSSSNFFISLACSPNGYLFAGRQGGQLFRSVQNTISVQKISSKIPESFILYQNYPNPFNPFTKIKFSIPHSSPTTQIYVSLKIHDILGREIGVLVNEKLSPGMYEIEWDGGGYSSGLYFYTLTYSSISKTLPMILVK